MNNITRILFTIFFVLTTAKSGDQEVLNPFQQEFAPHQASIGHPDYKGNSVLYSGLYPKAPRIHPYDHFASKTFIVIEMTPIRYMISDSVKHNLFPEISNENISIFFVAHQWGNDDAIPSLRPHYYIHNNLLANDLRTINDEKFIHAAIFPLIHQQIGLEGVGANKLLKDQSVCSHWTDEIQQVIASPDNLHITGYNHEENAFFASLIISPTQDKAALTFHYIPSQQTENGFDAQCENPQMTHDRILSDIMASDDYYASLISFVGQISGKLSPVWRECPAIPNNFDEAQYYQNWFSSGNIMLTELTNHSPQFGLVVYPELFDNKPYFQWAKSEYLKRHFVEYGQNHGLFCDRAK